MARTELPRQTRRTVSGPLYAVAGAGDLVVAGLRSVPSRLSDLRDDVPAPSQVVALPVLATAKVLDLTQRAGDAYDDLAQRGKDVVRRIRRQKSSQDLAHQATSTVRRTKAASTTAKKSATRTRMATKGAATSARKTASSAGKAAADAGSKIG